MVENKMVSIKINGNSFRVRAGARIMDVCRKNGYSIPSLCYLRGINEIGACRVCVVEVKGCERLITSCNNVVEEGMEIYTNSPRVREARKTNVELLLSQHHTNCPSCVRSANCELKQIASDLNLVTDRYQNDYVRSEWSDTFPLVRDAGKCIKCMRCVQICDKVQSLGVWDVSGTGSRTTVDVSFNRMIKDSDCALCGQCITHCPTAALQERDDVSKLTYLKGDLANPNKVTVAIIAPAVRTAWGEEFGMSCDVATGKKLVAALKAIGFDYVYDVNFTADLTIIEESNELLDRLSHKDQYQWPLFTSCCPGWVRFLKARYPEMTPQLSTAKSPQQMFGAVIKTYFAKRKGLRPEDISCISIMPCLAKKIEADLPGMQSAGTGKDVDFVLTTREICRLIKTDHLDVRALKEMEFDDPLGGAAGAGIIFGASGGVMEAAMRTAYFELTGENPDLSGNKNPLKAVRRKGSLRELDFEVNGILLRCAVVNSLGEADKLLKRIKSGKESFDFVEVMACPGGCVGGGGQPIRASRPETRDDFTGRTACLYRQDEKNVIRFSHENPQVLELYENYLGKPLSEKSHHLLHVDHELWEMPGSPVLDD